MKRLYVFPKRTRQQSSVHFHLIFRMVLILGLLFTCSENSFMFLLCNAMSVFRCRNILVSHKNSNIDITGEILRCLKPGQWLNDEVSDRS